MTFFLAFLMWWGLILNEKVPSIVIGGGNAIIGLRLTCSPLFVQQSTSRLWSSQRRCWPVSSSLLLLFAAAVAASVIESGKHRVTWNAAMEMRSGRWNEKRRRRQTMGYYSVSWYRYLQRRTGVGLWIEPSLWMCSKMSLWIILFIL